MPVLNDVHSRLNPTEVRRIARPTDLSSLQELVRSAARDGDRLSIGGGRHAMGAQQFAGNEVHVDMTGLNAVLAKDEARGLLRIEAGAMWPAIIAATRDMRGPGDGWAIRQKQTGVDEVTLGGSIGANAHGRGLHLAPLVDDIEDLSLVDAAGDLRHCSRSSHPELFALVVGGYGLFGIVYAATLRLTPRLRVARRVDILELRDAVQVLRRRMEQGCRYGDFQFVIDPDDPAFLQRGVLACYEPVAAPTTGAHEAEDGRSDLSTDDWTRLLRLAHDDKATAFVRYAQHYLGTHGKTYWADTMQLSTYLPSYPEFLAATRSSQDAVTETLVIGEHYVPHEHLLAFMEGAAEVLRSRQVEVIYGTIRLIRQDTTSFLPWAPGDRACVIFNLRTPHTPVGQQRTAEAFRGLVDVALSLGGSFFLTYHRYATREQVLKAYPAMPDFLAAKRRFDPHQRFVSDWYRHMCALVGQS